MNNRKRNTVRFGSTVNDEKDLVKPKGDNSLASILPYLNNLHGNAHHSIDSLSPDLKKQYEAVTSFVCSAHGTSDYKAFMNHVKDGFSHISSPVPGTVGAYFVGCLIPNSLDPLRRCGLLCSQALPREDEKSCMYSVYLLAKDDNGVWALTKISSSDSDENILLYYDANDTFPGLTTSQVQYLKSQGVQNVNVINYEGINYTESSFVPLDEIQTIPDSSSSAFDTDVLVLIIIIIIIILLFLFLSY